MSSLLHVPVFRRWFSWFLSTPLFGSEEEKRQRDHPERTKVHVRTGTSRHRRYAQRMELTKMSGSKLNVMTLSRNQGFFHDIFWFRKGRRPTWYKRRIESRRGQRQREGSRVERRWRGGSEKIVAVPSGAKVERPRFFKTARGHCAGQSRSRANGHQGRAACIGRAMSTKEVRFRPVSVEGVDTCEKVVKTAFEKAEAFDEGAGLQSLVIQVFRRSVSVLGIIACMFCSFLPGCIHV